MTRSITFTADCPHCELTVKLRLTKTQIKHLWKASKMSQEEADIYMARHLKDIVFTPGPDVKASTEGGDKPG